MKRNLRPMGDNLLIKMDPESEITSTGIIVKPKDAMETILRTGTVLAVGPGKVAKKGTEPTPIPVNVGDGVVFNRFVASNTKTAEALHQFALEEDEALIRGMDVLLAYDRDNPISIS